MKANAAKARDAQTPITKKIRKGLRKMMGGENNPVSFIDTKRRASEFNLTIINNITNETAVECRFTPTLDPDRVKELTDQQNFTNTIIVGYPGPDKRTVLRQMEAMTGLSGRDAWDFQFLGMTTQPFIKTNYPHHEGIWGWQDHGDQVVLVLRNPRRSIDEYHDILADIHYAKTWEEATDKIPDLFQGIIEADKYAMWRNERTMDEIGWYGWLIDYWMEDGLMRDYFDHKVTTPEHFALLREPETYTYGELQWDVNVCTDAVSLCWNDGFVILVPSFVEVVIPTCSLDVCTCHVNSFGSNLLLSYRSNNSFLLCIHRLGRSRSLSPTTSFAPKMYQAVALLFLSCPLSV